MRIKFYNIRSSAWINPKIKVSGVHFWFNKSVSLGGKYFNISEIEINVTSTENYAAFEEALKKLYALMTRIAVLCGGFCDVALPIEFSANDKDHVFKNGLIYEKNQKTKTVYAGNFLIDKLHRIRMEDAFFIYRESQDNNYPLDYRFLNMWRFFECFYKKKNKELYELLQKVHKKYTLHPEGQYYSVFNLTQPPIRIEIDPDGKLVTDFLITKRKGLITLSVKNNSICKNKKKNIMKEVPFINFNTSNKSKLSRALTKFSNLAFHYKKISPTFFKTSFINYRCAVAHASKTKSVSIPKKKLFNRSMAKRHRILSAIAKKLLLDNYIQKIK